jgi:hypothetical protein
VRSFLNRIKKIWRPHAGQLAFLSNDADVKVLACGRRWGKTDACAAQVVQILFGKTPSRHILVAPTLDQVRILFDRVLKFVDRLTAAGLAPWRSEPKIRQAPYP